jgi:phosphonate transport system ATP-binding protein
VCAVRGLDLSVGTGETVAVVGPSGAGKTTLLRLLGGTVRPTAGAVLADDVDLSRLTARELRGARARTGFVHQDHSLVPNLRVSQNVIAGKLGSRGLLASARSMMLPSEAELEEVHRLLERVGIPEKLFERTDTLSGGQQQRVAIARALFQAPGALLLDEPVASVDPARARSLMRLVIELAAEEGLTLVVSLHDLAIAREFLPRAVGMRGGRVFFDRPIEAVSEPEFEELYRLEAGDG